MLVNIKSNQIGDTIIEVMLALAVLGAIIGGGYSIATRSLNGVRVSQERSEATKLAEGQLEALKAKFTEIKEPIELYEGNDPADVPDDDSIEVALGTNPSWSAIGLATANTIHFCFDKDGKVDRFNFTGKPEDDFGSYSTKCIFPETGNRLYHVQISTTPAFINYGAPGSVVNFDYTVRVVWPRAGGGEYQTLTMQDRFTLTI